MAESGGGLNQLEQQIQAFMEKSNRKLQHMEEWYQNRFRTFHSSANLYEVQRTESEQRVSGDQYANHQYSDANTHLEHYNKNPYAYTYSHPYSQTCPYQVPHIYYYDSTNPGHYYVALSDGSVVPVTTVVAGPAQKEEQATRFRKNGKKRGYFSACRGRIEKPRKHPGCGGNAGRMHNHRIPFGKNHPSCFRKVSTRYFHRRRNLFKQKGTGKSSAQNDRAEQAVQDDEENPLEVTSSELVEGLFDEILKRTETDLEVQKLIVVSEDSQQEALEVEDNLEKKSETNEEQVFDNSPQKNETEVLNNKQSVVVISSHQKGVTKKAVHEDEEETPGQLKFENDGIEDGRKVKDKEDMEGKVKEDQVFDESPPRGTTEILSQIRDKESFRVPLCDQGYLLPSKNEKSVSNEILSVEYDEPTRNRKIASIVSQVVIEVADDGKSVTSEAKMSIVTAHISSCMLGMCVLCFDYHFGQLVYLRSLNMGFGCEEDSLMSGYPKSGENMIAVKQFKEILNRNTVSDIVMLYSSKLKGKSEKRLRLLIPAVADFEVHDYKFLILGVRSNGGTIHELMVVWEPNHCEGFANEIRLGSELKPRERNKVFTDVKRVTEEHEWNKLFKIEKGSNSFGLEECEWNHIEHQLKVLSTSKGILTYLRVFHARTFVGSLETLVNIIVAKEDEQCVSQKQMEITGVPNHNAGGADKFHGSLLILEYNMLKEENIFEEGNNVKWLAIKGGIYSKITVQTIVSIKGCSKGKLKGCYTGQGPSPYCVLQVLPVNLANTKLIFFIWSKVIWWYDKEDASFGNQFMHLTNDNTYVIVFNAQLSWFLQVTAIVTEIVIVWMLLQFLLTVVSILLILNLSFFLCTSYEPRNIVQFLNFDHLVALSWECVNYFVQFHNFLSSSMVELSQLLLIFRIVEYLVEDFVDLGEWRIVRPTKFLSFKQVDETLTFEDVHYLDKSMVILIFVLLVVVAIDHFKITDGFLGKLIMFRGVKNFIAGGNLFVVLRMKSYGGNTDLLGCECASLLFGSKLHAIVLGYPCGDHWFKIWSALSSSDGAAVAIHGNETTIQQCKMKSPHAFKHTGALAFAIAVVFLERMSVFINIIKLDDTSLRNSRFMNLEDKVL